MEEKKIDLTKPNTHLKEPLFEGLPWTARDFDILHSFLSEELISYIEDREGPLEDGAMERLLEMCDECWTVYANSEFAKERIERLKLRKELRNRNKNK